MLCSKQDLEIYKRFKDNILCGEVKPYDEDLINYLNNFTDKNNENFNNYLEGLMSEYNVGKDSLFTKYLMLFLNQKEYKIHKGILSAFSDRRFNHDWIEGKNDVYDTTFIGKWSKEEFYNTFKPITEKIVDLENDSEFRMVKNNNIEVINTNNIDFSYIDWYRYMKNNTVSFHPEREALQIVSYKSEEKGPVLKWMKR